MPAHPVLRLLTALLVLTGASAVLLLGATLIRHVSGVHGGLVLTAWAMAFAVLFPVGLATLAVLAPYAARRPARSIVPNAGWKVPRAGQ